MRVTYGSLQDHPTNEVFGRIIITLRAVDKNGGEHICQSVDIDTMKVINSIVSACSACSTVIGDICLGEEICNVSLRVNNGSADDAYVVGNVGTADI